MDRITESNLTDFVANSGYLKQDLEVQFEHFVNYCVVSGEHHDTFDLDSINCGAGGDTALDGIAIFVNGAIIDNEQEVEDLISRNGYLEVKILLIQSKTSAKFDMGEIRNFLFGSRDLFSANGSMPRNEKIKYKAQIIQFILQNGNKMRKRIVCNLYYATTGSWRDSNNLSTQIGLEVEQMENMNIFEKIIFSPIDANELHKKYQNTKNSISITFEFPKKIALPAIPGIKQSYIGVIKALDYIKVISDESENILKKIFYDNVRDYQGENEVNSEIKATLSRNSKHMFAVLNNGITIITDNLTVLGDVFTMKDYQIVNGCQTSYILFNERQKLDENVFVPLKVIESGNEEITNEIIKATNQQTAITKEELNALTSFEKKLEDFYGTFKGKQALYYERRSGQYNRNSAIERVRIINRETQVKVIAAVFFSLPHLAGRYHKQLRENHSKNIFKDDHSPLAYYATAYTYYRVDFLLRNNLISISRNFRYHLVWGIWIYFSDGSLHGLNKVKKLVPICTKIVSEITGDFEAVSIISAIIEIINRVKGSANDREVSKTKDFTEKLRIEILKLPKI